MAEASEGVGQESRHLKKEAHVNWLWLNIPLMAMFFAAMTGIPLWLTFKYPDRRAVPMDRQAAALVTFRAAGGDAAGWARLELAQARR